MEKINAAAYARYSTEHQNTSSIEYQMRKIDEYCADNNIRITARYADEAYSGTNTDRPSFIQLCEDAKLRKFDAVVIYDISRGSRDVSDWFAFRKQMALLNIQVISVEDRIGDIMNPSDYLTELITVGLGQHHVLTSRRKSMDSIATKAKTGVFLGGTPNLGYDIVDGHYVINHSEAQTVRTIFRLYAEGKSYDDIIKSIGTVYGKRGRPLGKNSLHYILKCERYIGVYTWCKRHVKIMGKWAGGTPNENAVRIEGAIPRIIDDETWERVQDRMSDRKHRAVNKAKREYLLSGLIECAECGASYVGHSSKNSKGYETRCYICGNKYRTRSCNAKNINAEEIEACVVQNLKMYLLGADFQKIADEISGKINSASPDLNAERIELADVTAQIANGTKAILKGIDYPELQTEMFKLRVRKSELEDIISRSDAKNPVEPERIVGLFNHAVDNWDTDLRNILRSMIRVYAHHDGSFDISLGVHIASCGGQRHVICTIKIKKAS